MSKPLRRAILVIAVSVTASTLPAAGEMHPALHVKPGLWEFNSTGKVVGDTVFRDALLAGVPPAQRAQHLAWLREEISRPNKERECLSQAGFERQILSLGSGCKQTVVANTPSRFEVLTECRAEDHGWKDESSNRTVVSPTEAIISEHGVSSRAGKTMTRDTVQHGRWISSNCGNLRGIQVL